jgi:hypothetical protein
LNHLNRVTASNNGRALGPAIIPTDSDGKANIARQFGKLSALGGHADRCRDRWVKLVTDGSICPDLDSVAALRGYEPAAFATFDDPGRERGEFLHAIVLAFTEAIFTSNDCRRHAYARWRNEFQSIVFKHLNLHTSEA